MNWFRRRNCCLMNVFLWNNAANDELLVAASQANDVCNADEGGGRSTVHVCLDRRSLACKSSTEQDLDKSSPNIIWEERVALPQLCNKVPIGYNQMPKVHPQNCPFDDHHPHLIHPSLDRPRSPFQTASRSNQPFCHSRPTLSGQTDR